RNGVHVAEQDDVLLPVAEHTDRVTRGIHLGLETESAHGLDEEGGQCRLLAGQGGYLDHAGEKGDGVHVSTGTTTKVKPTTDNEKPANGFY
ncbi:MAG: hypothetical protein H6Q86_5115, partial [candidate division NC10 bacterium]|nr:hypothetical protein [candidate division NC10 bacterium]